jgi:chemosensory pili system protein ChpA (sensor histidine kinase/response regulator)
MSKILKAELVELFMQEAASYIPGIRQSLATLAAEGAAPAALEELHRLFHTIKGAASQVQLTDLSRGARVVETFLSELIEEGRELSSQHLAALEGITGMLSEAVENPDSSPEIEENFHARVVAQFDDLAESAANESGMQAARAHRTVLEEQQECLHAIRSIVPLLQELAGCLVPAEKGREDHNVIVYRKLSRAVAVFTTAVRSAGMDRQYQLMQDFQLLLGELRAGEMWRQPEVAGLIEDFFRFLEAVFTHSDPENSSTVHRVKDQLRAFRTLLAGTQSQIRTRDAAEAEFAFDEEIFSAREGDDESVILLEQLVDNELLEETVEAPEIPTDLAETESEFEPASEEQLLLQEIFRSECDEHLIVINHSLNTLEQQVEQPCSLTPDLRETVSVMRRAVHTLKGAASMTGVNLLAQGAHSLEDLLDWLHDDAGEISPAEVRILATGIDVIELLSQSPAASSSAHLNRLVETIKAHLAKAAGDHSTAGDSEEVSITEALEETESAAADQTASPEAVEMEEQAALPGDSGILRVRLDDLDELVSIEGELVVARGAVEKMLDEFGQTLIEFDNVKENLRRKSQELEAGFEVKSLYGFNPVAPGGPAGESAESDFSEFDPIELDRYSQLNLIIRSLNEITVDINSIHATLALLAGDIRGQVSKQQLTMRLMQDKLMRIRMTPMSSLSRMLFRIVRETARKLNKKVNLVITGEDVYMDRFVWAKITDPLMHILRNAVDHGIESAERRRADNKPETATIRLEADQRSRFVVLRVSDDGGGVDLERIKTKLRSEGLVADPDALSENELIEYLFHPSFTTRWDVSTISGRGIGLDVVRKNIQELRGSVQLHNNPGKGVSFEFHIPFTLSVNRAAIVSAAGREFAVPLQDIQQVKRYRISELETGDGLFLRVGDGLIAVTNLGYHLQLENRQTELPAGGEGVLAIVFKRGEELYAISIEEVVEQREIIVKSLGSHLTHVPGVSGVTLTGSGELIPILNLRELTEIQAQVAKGPAEPVLSFGLNEPLKVLIVDDSISVRHSVARLVESQAWKQQQAVDGLDALAKLETFLPDVIVLDIEMPRMNGYEFKSTINNNEAYRDIPVIMLTSRTSEKHQQKARELGIHHYMTKPYQEAAFVRLLENIRGGSKAA